MTMCWIFFKISVENIKKWSLITCLVLKMVFFFKSYYLWEQRRSRWRWRWWSWRVWVWTRDTSDRSTRPTIWDTWPRCSPPVWWSKWQSWESPFEAWSFLVWRQRWAWLCHRSWCDCPCVSRYLCPCHSSPWLPWTRHSSTPCSSRRCTRRFLNFSFNLF